MSISSCAPPGRYCSILSTGIGIATSPGWTPGAGDGDGDAKGFGFGVGVGNECGNGVGPGVGGGVGPALRLCAKAVEQTLDVPRNAAQIMVSLIDLTRSISYTSFSSAISELDGRIVSKRQVAE
jgi:hypothetical protein